MPIIKKFEIQRYKELDFDIPYGVYDTTIDYMGGFSESVLQSFDDNPNGNWHFFGLLKNSYLLGEVVSHTLDTGNISLQQFNQLTNTEVDNLVKQGIFIKKVGEVIGWIEINKSIPSFFYQDCYSGKIPIVDLWYDYGKINLSETLVSDKIRPDYTDDQGNLIKQVSPDTIGTWNFFETLGNWGSFPFPRQPELTFNQYMEIVINQVSIENTSFTKLNSTKYYSIPILYANKAEHFDSDETYPTSISFFSNKPTYGKLRKPEIPFGFKFSTNRYTGQCIPIGGVKITDKTGLDVGVPRPKTDVNIEETTGYDYRGMSPDELSKEYTIVPTDTEITVSSGVPDKSIDVYQSYTSGQYNRLYYHRSMINFGVNDPRDLYGDDIDSPIGILHANYNRENEKISFKPAVLKETIQTSIPSEIGPVRKTLARKMRREVIKMYKLYDGVYSENTDGPIYSELGGTSTIHRRRPLFFSIGKDKNGTVHYSENESFREKCVFTGYYNSFQYGYSKTIKFLYDNRNTNFWNAVYNDFYKLLSNAGYTGTQINSNIENIPVVYRSKTHKYYFTSSPSKTIFAGYYENDTQSGKTTPYDRFLNLLFFPYGNGDSKYINVPKFEVDEYRRPIFYNRGVKRMQVNSTDMSLFDILSKNIYKDDFIVEKTRLHTLTNIYSGTTNVPSLFKRQELFIPNPMDNLLYADMVLWDPNLVNYDPVYSLGLLSNTFNRDFYDLFSKNNGRIVSDETRYEKPKMEYSDDIGYYISITDKTYITDVYFGLMEMHIKGYPWRHILQIINSHISNSPIKINLKPSGNSKLVKVYTLDSSIMLEKNISDPFWRSKEFENSLKLGYEKIINAFTNAWDYISNNIIKH